MLKVIGIHVAADFQQVIKVNSRLKVPISLLLVWAC